MTVTAGGPTVVTLGARSLVVVGGIPGAGKSTLLRTVAGDRSGGPRSGAPTVVDSEPLRDRLRSLLPAGTPYRLYRPLVHLWHRARIVGVACSGVPTVVVHLPATAGFTRSWLAVVGMLTARRRLLLWLDAAPMEARRGQHERSRVVARAGFARHVRRGLRFSGRLRAGHRPPGWRVIVLNRAVARRGLVLAATGPR